MTRGPIELKTDRLALRPFTFGDVDDYFEYAVDPEFGRYINQPRPFTRRRAEEDVAGSILNSWESLPSFVVVLDGKVVGDIFLNIKAWNGASGVGDLGVFIATPHWGKGLAPEAAKAVVDLGFQEYGLAKITSHSDTRNEAALRVMEKLGMTQEGRLRKHVVRQEERKDMAVFGILQQEWLAAKGKE